MPKKLLATLAAATLALAGCSSAPSEPVNASTIDELHQYVVDAGAECDVYEDRGEAPMIANSSLRACADDFVLATSPDFTQAKVWCYAIHDLGADVLIGNLWAISADPSTLDKLRDSIGGVIVTDERD